MTSRHLIIIISFIILSCSSNNEVQEGLSINDQIITLQKKAKKQKDSTLFYLDQADKIIEQYSSKVSDSLEIENSYLKGNYYLNNKGLDSASSHFYTVIERINDTIRSKRKTDYFYGAWNVYYQMGEYGECLAISQKFEKLLAQDNIEDRKKVYYQYVTTYRFSQDYEKASQYNDLYIDLLRQTNDSIELLSALGYKASFQYNLGNKQAAYDIFEDLLKKQHLLDSYSKIDIHSDYGVALHLDKDFNNARNHYLEVLKALKDIRDSQYKVENEVINYANLGEVHLDLKEYQKAIQYLDTALSFEKKYMPDRTYRNILKYRLRYAFETESDFPVVENDFNKLLEFQNKDYKEKYQKDLLSLETSYAKERHLENANRIAELENLKLRTRQIIIFLSSLLLISIGYVLYRRRQYGFQKESLQMQQRLLRSQMNPHFTFNTLYAIQNMIKINQQGAIDYLLKFSRLLRLILENSVHNYIPLEKELESLQKYIDLQLLRFPERFNYTVEFSPIEDDGEDELYIPPMLLQPFIENSIEHGFQGIDYKGGITITLIQGKKFISCHIEDNGKGLTEKSSKRVSSTQLISHFIEKTTKKKIKSINKKKLDSNQTGVIIEFLIPYKYVADD